MFFFFLKDQQVSKRDAGSISGSYACRSPQWDLHFFLLHPQASPSFSSSAGSGSSSPSTRQAPCHYNHSPALGDWWGSTAAGASTGWAGWGGAFRIMTLLPGGVLAKNLPTLIPHQPTIINIYFILNLHLQDFFSRILWASPGAIALRSEVQIQYWI